MITVLQKFDWSDLAKLDLKIMFKWDANFGVVENAVSMNKKIGSLFLFSKKYYGMFLQKKTSENQMKHLLKSNHDAITLL